MTKFKNILTPEVTVGQLRAARDDVVSAYVELDRAAQDVAYYRIISVEAAQEKLGDAVDDVDRQATVPQAVESLENEASGVQAAISDLRADVKC